MSSDSDDNFEADACSFYKFTREDVEAVNAVNWTNKLKELCPKTRFLQVPPEVLKYLKSDGMVMPQNTHTTAHSGNGGKEEDDDSSWASLSDSEEVPSIPSEFLQRISRQEREQVREGRNGDGGANGGNGHLAENDNFDDLNDKIWERRSDSSSSSDDEAAGFPQNSARGRGRSHGGKKSMEVEKFHEFDSLLDASIKELGGAVIPKVNRKSPRDATWIGFNRSLKCYSPGDIYLLLKTSDVVSQVLEDPYKDCLEQASGGASALAVNTTPYTLILKQWIDSWGPEMEFRCFVCSNQLIAVCQRDLDTCHSSIIKRKDKLLVNIQNFFLRYIQNTFPIDYYVIDILCHPNGEIYVVDFDVFGLVTDPLLFTYRELEAIYLESFVCDDIINAAKTDNRVIDGAGAREGPAREGPSVKPCLRFLTESRNFRARKVMRHPELVNDVMTYIRGAASRD